MEVENPGRPFDAVACRRNAVAAADMSRAAVPSDSPAEPPSAGGCAARVMAGDDDVIMTEKSVGVAGVSIASGFEGEIMIQERCIVWCISDQSKTIRIAVPAVMGEFNNVFRD
ncbi:hypothetical protein [Oryza sativa Japonica Group]|uniref:Uncharacterized protein n=1 Tax=Oryza sativa subsp. japonica TaxID=39947 RepID=Q656U5_ORYSJ|nr:hypothetical protein [Oryza sativa Japonica Group]BAD45170.1 hypothetical protein [Oryza sativa Japonica Group]